MTESAPDIDRLRRLVQRLRAPDGCPWDREQTLGSVRAYLLEEAHEAAAALDRVTDDGAQDLSDELGDLLFQVTFVAALAEEDGLFDLRGVIDGVHDKMVERHPHVFGDDRLETAGDVARAWERRKQAAGTDENGARRSALAGVPESLPALLGAYRLGQKAAGLGFDWPDTEGVTAKVREEVVELEQRLDDDDREGAEEELGDLLFSLANLSRHLGLDPERALAGANRKFRRRFAHVETQVDGAWDAQTLDTLEAHWQRAKELESEPSDDA